MKLTGATVFTASVAGCRTVHAEQAKDSSASGETTGTDGAALKDVGTAGDVAKKAYAESEFAPLKRVVLTQSKVSMGSDGETLPEEDQAAWEKGRIELEAVLKKYDVKVQRPRLLSCGKSSYPIRYPFPRRS